MGEHTISVVTYKLNQSGGVLKGYAADLDTTVDQATKGAANSQRFAGVFEADCDNGKIAEVAPNGVKKVVAGAITTLAKYAITDSAGRFINLPVNATPVSYYVVGRFEEAAGAAGDFVNMDVISPPIVISS